jgi:hypothetical protein
VREFILKIVGFVIILIIIFAIFWGVKRQNWITIEATDQSMAPDYSGGTYHMSPRPLSQEELVIGKAYAFVVPEIAEQEKRVAWLVAKEGQRVEIKEKGIYVDGAKSDCRIALGRITVAVFVIPRGTVYLVSAIPERDSITFGPIPFRNVLGQL